MRLVSRWLAYCVVGVSLVASAQSIAEVWPTKPIRLINPFPAGGGTDTFARPLSAQLSKQTGQQLIRCLRVIAHQRHVAAGIERGMRPRHDTASAARARH